MIGNDVVDLKLCRIESNWQRKGFLEKIFTDRELILITNSKNQELLVWQLWSIKEAAYKIWNRQRGQRLFNPKFFKVFLKGNNKGNVVFDNKVYFSKTFFNQNFIHSVVVDKGSDFKTIVYLSNRKKIIKKNGLPFFDDGTNVLNPNVSISNHGVFEKIVMLKSQL